MAAMIMKSPPSCLASDEAALAATASFALLSKQSAIEEQPCEDLDTLADQMLSSCSLTQDYYQSMVSYLHSDVAEKRYEALRVFRTSLAISNASANAAASGSARGAGGGSTDVRSRSVSTSSGNNSSNCEGGGRNGGGGGGSSEGLGGGGVRAGEGGIVVSGCRGALGDSSSSSVSLSMLSSCGSSGGGGGSGERGGNSFHSSVIGTSSVGGDIEHEMLDALGASSSCTSSSSTSSSSSSSSSSTTTSTTTSQLDISIQDVLDAGLLPPILECLRGHEHPKLQLEATLLLNHITLGSTQQTQVVVDSGAINLLVSLLPSTRFAGMGELRHSILMVLRNIAVDSPHLRDRILQSPGAAGAILRAAQQAKDLTGVKVVHALMCQSPLASLVDIPHTVDYLGRCIHGTKDPQVLSMACSGCMTICEKVSGVECLLQSGCMPIVIKLMEHPSKHVYFEALSVIAKVAYTGTTSQIDQLIRCGAVYTLVKLLDISNRTSPSTRARACNALGNIGCETPRQVDPLIQADAFPLLVEVFRYDPDYNTRIEAAYAVCAAVSRADGRQVGYIVSCTSRCEISGDCNCMQLIADMLELVKASDPQNASSLKLCKAILRGLDNILEMGKVEGRKLSLAENPYSWMFQEVQGLNKLSQMQFYPDYDVASKTQSILEKYFSFSVSSVRQQ